MDDGETLYTIMGNTWLYFTKNYKNKVNIADLIRQTKHKRSSDSLFILYDERKGERLDLLEAYKINKV